MSLWKPFRGNRTALEAVEKHDGYVYFCIDDGSLFFDYKDADGVLHRKQINANEAESILGYSISATLNSSDVEIPTSKAVFDALDKKADKSDLATESADGLMSAADKKKLNEIAEKAEANVQSDWNETDSNSDAFIQNKPNVVLEGDSRLTDARTPTSHTHGKISNDGALDAASRIVVTDANKKIVTGTIDPSQLVVTTDSRLTDARTPLAHGHSATEITEDDDHQFVTKAQKEAWNGKSGFSGDYNDLINKPTIPTIPDSLPADGGNADTVDGKHAGDFALKDHGTHVTADTVKAALETGSGTTKYLREDGTWAIPPDTITEYSHPTYTERAKKLYKVHVDAQGHVDDVTEVVKADITALGIPDKNTTYSDAIANGASGLMSGADKDKLDNIEAGAKANVQSDWNQTDDKEDDYIKNKPTALKNPQSLTIGGETYDGSSAVEITATELRTHLGIDNALHFIGLTTTEITDGATVTSITVKGKSHTAAAGDVVLYNDNEYVFDGSNWLELGDGSSHALKTNTITAGKGLTDGGQIGSNPTLNVGAGDGITVTDDAIAVKAGNGITVDSNGINHAATSSQQSIAADGRKYVTGVTLDAYGHVTKLTTGTETVVDTNTTYDLAASKNSTNGSVKVNLTAGGSGSGTDSVTIKGTGATTVTTDANGVVTISSTDYTTALNNKADKTTVESLATAVNEKINEIDEQIRGDGSNDSFVGTWIFNDTLTAFDLDIDEYVAFDCVFKSYDEWNFGVDYTGFTFSPDPLTFSFNRPGPGATAYSFEDNTWFDERYKTVQIIDAPTDSEFITWFKANATKQKETLNTESKAIIGAINELHSEIGDISTALDSIITQTDSIIGGNS
jgi:hypothetical protein